MGAYYTKCDEDSCTAYLIFRVHISFGEKNMNDILFKKRQEHTKWNKIQVEIQHQHYIDQKREGTSKFILPGEQRTNECTSRGNACPYLTNSVDVSL